MELIDKILFEVKYSQKVKSSNLKSVRYDSKTKILQITFHGDVTYEYSNVPLTVYKQLIKAKSKGRFAYYNICYEYPYERLN